MTITLELKPEDEAQAQAQAQARGLPLEAYLASVIEAQVLPARQHRPSLDEFEADLDAMAEGSDDIPVLLPEALIR